MSLNLFRILYRNSSFTILQKYDEYKHGNDNCKNNNCSNNLACYIRWFCNIVLI